MSINTYVVFVIAEAVAPIEKWGAQVSICYENMKHYQDSNSITKKTFTRSQQSFWFSGPN